VVVDQYGGGQLGRVCPSDQPVKKTRYSMKSDYSSRLAVIDARLAAARAARVVSLAKGRAECAAAAAALPSMRLASRVAIVALAVHVAVAVAFVVERA